LENMVSRRCPAAADKRRDQPPDSDQVKKSWEKLAATTRLAATTGLAAEADSAVAW
jgi:hypothetical protein